jgi:hypothetical protein
VLVVGCSESGNSSRPAITVNKTKYSTGQVIDELRTIAANPKLAAYYKGDDVKLVPKPDTIDPDIASSWVTSLAYQGLIDPEFKRRKLTTAAIDRREAKDKASQIFGGKKIFAAFPKDFQNLVVDRQVRLEALQADLPPAAKPTEADLRTLFAAVQKQCPTAKLLSQTWSSTKAKADAIVAAVRGGQDFATVAHERSEDEVTTPRGGLLTCVGAAQYNQFDANIRAAAEALPMGGTSDPIAGADGFFVYNVQPMTYESILPLLEIEFRRKQFTPLAAFIVEQMKRADPLKVAKAFGSVVRSRGNAAITSPDSPIDLSG